MAFEKLTKPIPRSQLLDWRGLALMTDEQYEAEKAFWEEMHGASGFWQMEFAGDFMLGTVFPRVQDFRDAVAEAGGLPHGEPGPYTIAHARKGIAGLALGALVRSEAYGGRVITGAGTGTGPGALALDADMDGPMPLTFAHDTQERAAQFLPGYDPNGPPAKFQDGPLVVTTVTPARPTANYTSRFEAIGGAEFDPSGYVTLRPQLLAAYVEGYPPSTPPPVV
jgi:hypothetical protein